MLEEEQLYQKSYSKRTRTIETKKDHWFQAGCLETNFHEGTDRRVKP